MTNGEVPLAPGALLEHARASARGDEERHSAERTGPRLLRHSEQTIRGWGSAALLDLEWTSHYVYPKAQREEYRRVYAAEYLRLRAARPPATCP
jgi:hypothetical protein